MSCRQKLGRDMFGDETGNAGQKDGLGHCKSPNEKGQRGLDSRLCPQIQLNQA
jgi:hypothetical protein